MLEIPQLVVCGGNLKQMQVLRQHSWRPLETILNERFGNALKQDIHWKQAQGFQDVKPARKKENLLKKNKVRHSTHLCMLELLQLSDYLQWSQFSRKLRV